MYGTLYLIPTPLGAADVLWLPDTERQRILHLRHFVVEASKTARLHLKSLGIPVPVRDLVLNELNEHTDLQQISSLLDPLLAGTDVGLLSEAGCPAVADPGAQLVALAHENGIDVQPLIGPSSILLALMVSGANGQRFAFHGYLPVDRVERDAVLKKLEVRSKENNESQMFIEAPYRNDKLLAQCRQTLSPTTRLCIACDLNLPTQTIISRRLIDWPISPVLHKRPCIFLLYAE